MDCNAICLAEDCGAYGAGEHTSYIVSGKCWVNNHAHVLIPKECCDIEFAERYNAETGVVAEAQKARGRKAYRKKYGTLPLTNSRDEDECKPKGL